MESNKNTSKYFASTVTADNFFECLENGYLANIIRDNPRAMDAWIAGTNTPDRPAPHMHEITIPGHPGVAAIPAILADPDNGILGVDAVAAVIAMDDFFRFGHTAAGTLSAAGEAAFRTALEKHSEHLESDRRHDSTTMQNYISSYTPEFQRLVRDFAPVEFGQYVSENRIWDLTVLSRRALSGTNLNSASHALNALLHQPPPTRTGDLKTELTAQSLRTLHMNVKNVFGADTISINQLAVQGFIQSLCPVRDADFISWFNDKYPTGVCDLPYVIFDRYKLMTLSKSAERILIDNNEASHMTFRKDEQELLAFISRAERNHGANKMDTLMARCLTAKNLHTRLHPLLVPKGQKRTAPDQKPDSKSDGKTESKGDTTPLKEKPCATCKQMFTPTYFKHVTCPACWKKSSTKALQASTDQSAETDTDLSFGDNFGLCARFLSATTDGAPSPSIPCFWDNGSSLNLTSDLSLMEQVHDVKPFKVGGPSAKMTITKIGIFPALPAPKNIAYYTKDTEVTLISLGNWCRNGGKSTQDATELLVYDVSGPNPTLFDTAPLASNDMSPISPSIWTVRRSGEAAPCTRWKDVFDPEYVALPSTQLLYSELGAYHAAPDPTRHYTAEQIRRCDEVQNLHHVYCHINDHDLGVMLDTGLIRTPLNSTSRDVAINRVLRLNCPQCLEGTMHNPHYGNSTAQPAEEVGESIQLDLGKNPVPAASGGATHELMLVDDHSGEIGIVGVTDKTGPEILHSTLKYLNSHYRAHGHNTVRLSADAESVFKSMVPLFGKAGYVLTLMPPGQHAQRLERYQQTLLNHYISTVSSCPFYFPLKYQMQIRSAIAYTMSLCPNSLTSPTTPFVMRTGARHKLHPLADKLRIGSTCMVQCGQASRVSTAKSAGQTVKTTPRSELGVCLGPSQVTPGAYDFILASGLIVPRRLLSIVNVIPFNWKPRSVVRPYIESPPTKPAALPKAPLAPRPEVFPSSVSDTLSTPTVRFSLPDTAGLPSALPSNLSPSPGLPDSTRLTADPASDSPVVRILSHTGNLNRLASCEFQVEYQDGDTGYDWEINLRGTDPFTEYLQLNRRPPIPRAPQPAPAKLPGTRASSRLSTHSVPDLDGWTLINSGPTSALLTRTARSPVLPSHLDFLFDDDEDDIDDALQTLPPPKPLVSSFDSAPDLDWYSPSTSATSSATVTASLPWTLDQEPSPAAGTMTYAQAHRLDKAGTLAALDREMAKYFELYDVCRREEAINFKDIPAGALKQHNRILFKQKFKADGTHDKFTARNHTDGSHQPSDTYYSTYAAVSDNTDKLATLAAYNARANQLKWPLALFTFDITAFFLQNRLTPANSPVDCYIRMPPDIPHFSAGKWYPRRATTYGSKNANNIADTGLHEVLASAGFFSNPEAPRTYTKVDPTDPRISCTVNMHVDDGNGCSFCPAFVDDLRKALEARYGPLDWSDNASSHTGIRLQRYTDGSISVDQSGHIARMLSDLGATALPFVSKPSLDDFFDPPTNLTAINKKYYQHLIGNIVYCMTTKTNLRKEIQYLSTRQAAPVQSDLDKVIRLLAYMLHHPDEHIRFSGTDYQIHLWCDASYGSHPDGRSHDAYFITVGENNGAICSHSSKQTHCVAQGSMEAEYVALTPGAKRALHFRRFLHAMGFSQTGPIVIHEDNKSAINLAHSPQIPRNSQHIHVRYHFIRDLVAAKIVRFVYTATTDMIADLLTKTLPLGPMQRFTSMILNLSSTPLVPQLKDGLSLSSA